MSSSVILLVGEDRADMDGVEGVRGTAVPDRLDRNYASLHLTVA